MQGTLAAVPEASAEGPQERVVFLSRIPFWGELPQPVLEAVAAASSPDTYAPGRAILSQGETGASLHILRRGRAQVWFHKDPGAAAVPGPEMGVGSCFGEMSLLTGDPVSADVVAVDEVETLRLDRDTFTQLLHDQPDLMRHFVGVLSKRIVQKDDTHIAAYEREQEIARFLREDRAGTYDAIVGHDASARALERVATGHAQRDEPLLIQGERGTGKELLARRIHYQSARRDAPLLSVDCSQIRETNRGDTLFGDEGGPPGARARTLAYADLADGGTLLLKNVDDLPPRVMARLGQSLVEQPPRVRAIATYRGRVAEDSGQGTVLRNLPGPLVENVASLAPLRERKRDIPRLAQHFVQRHAERTGSPARQLDDQAVAKLVLHDYSHGNVRELEEIVARAVVLTDTETIAAEAIFLPVPRRSGGAGPDLLKLAGPLRARVLRIYRGVLRWAVAAFFVAMTAALFLWPAATPGRLALVAVWGLWWPALALSFVTVGRVWCAVCPVAWTGSIAQRLHPPGRQIVPAWLKKRESMLVAGGFATILWVEEATGMRHSPTGTGLLLLSLMAGAITAGVLLPRRSWCRHICPLGGLAGASALSASLELRPTPDICGAKCKGHSCFKGNAHVPGCPMFQHVMFLDSNSHCVLCMSCVESCPNDSPRLALRLPGRDLWSGLQGRPEAAWFTTVLVGLLPALGLLQAWERAPVEPFAGWLAGSASRVAVVTALFFGSAILPLLAVRVAAGHARGNPESEERLWARAMSWLPAAATALAAYQISFLPGIGGLRAGFAYAGQGSGTTWSFGAGALSLLQAPMVVAGLLLAGLVYWRVRSAVKGVRPSRIRLGVGLVAITCWCLVILGLLPGLAWFDPLGAGGAFGVLATTGVAYAVSQA